jgi:hypothetical protein
MPFISLVEKSENIDLSLSIRKNKDISPNKISEPSLGQKRKLSEVFPGKNLNFENKNLNPSLIEKKLPSNKNAEFKMTGDLRDFFKRFKK